MGALEDTPRTARDRILDTAYGLLAQRGVRGVGIDEIISRSQVAKATFYRHFRTKDDLVLAFMDRWYALRHDDIERATAQVGSPDSELIAFFSVLDAWFKKGSVEVSAFLHVMIEMGPDHHLGQAAMAHLAEIRNELALLADKAGLEDPSDFAWSFHLLTKGAIITALEGDEHAALRARKLAEQLITTHRPANADDSEPSSSDGQVLPLVSADSLAQPATSSTTDAPAQPAPPDDETRIAAIADGQAPTAATTEPDPS